MEKKYGRGYMAEREVVHDTRTEALGKKDPSELSGEVKEAAKKSAEELLAKAEQDPNSFAGQQKRVREEMNQAMAELFDRLNEITGGAVEAEHEYERTPETTQIEREIEKKRIAGEMQRTQLWIQDEGEFLTNLDSDEEWLENVDNEKANAYRESKEAYKKSIEERIQMHEKFLAACQKALEELDAAENPREAVRATFAEHWDADADIQASRARNTAAEQYFDAAKEAGDNAIRKIRSERSQRIHDDMHKLQQLSEADQQDEELLEHIRRKFTGSTEHPNLVTEMEALLGGYKEQRAQQREDILTHTEVMYTGKVSERSANEGMDPRNDPRRQAIHAENIVQLQSMDRMLGEDAMNVLSAAMNERYSVGPGKSISIEDYALNATRLRKMADEMRAVLRDDYHSPERQKELAQAMGILDSAGNENTQGLSDLLDRYEKFGSIFPDESTEEQFQETE